MTSPRPTFNPDDPKDVSEFPHLLFDLHLKGMTGADQAIVLVTDLAASNDGKKLLHNAHRAVSAQIGKIPDAKIFKAQRWMQKLTGMLGSAVE